MNHLSRYSWPAALLITAWLAPNLAVALTITAAACLFAVACTLRRPELDRSLQRVHWRLGVLAVLGELFVLLAVMTVNLDITIARNYALLVVLATVPFGLEMTLAVLLRQKRHQSTETVRTAVGYAAEDAHTMLVILAISFAGTLLLHIPPALSAVQLLIIGCLSRALLSGKALQATPHKVDQAWRVLFASLTVYGSYVFFFIRHYLNPLHADSSNQVTWQATTTALAVFVICQAALLLFNPNAPKVIIYRALALLGLLLLVSYLPVTQSYLMTAGLVAADWVWVIIASLFYTALCLLQRQSALHSRKAVISLHRQSGA